MTTIAEENEKLEAIIRDKADRLGLGEEIKRRMEMRDNLFRHARENLLPAEEDQLRKILQAL